MSKVTGRALSAQITIPATRPYSTSISDQTSRRIAPYSTVGSARRFDSTYRLKVCQLAVY